MNQNHVSVWGTDVNECDHDWELVDDSFDHDYGCASVVEDLFAKCDGEKEYEGDDL